MDIYNRLLWDYEIAEKQRIERDNESTRRLWHVHRGDLETERRF